MKKSGIWIDHRRAVVVSIDGVVVPVSLKTETIVSGVEARVRMAGGAGSSTPYGPQDVTYEARRDRRHELQLERYYNHVIESVSGSNQVLVIGPGEAKTEFAKRLRESGAVRADRVIVTPADKMTEAQVVESVKAHFGLTTREV